MKIYITYFYNIRFFPKEMIPVSTAISDPKWYHLHNDPLSVYKDKRNVYNGIRLKELSPALIEAHNECCNCLKDKESCNFLNQYRDYLFTLKFENLYSKLETLAAALSKNVDLSKEPSICLMVHEKPDNPCSERWALMEYFKANGHELIEFNKDDFI